MNTGSLNQLHDTRQENFLSVADSIYLNFLTNNVFIYKYRSVLVHFNGSLEVMTEHLLICHNLHGTSTQHEARTNQNRIAYSLRSLNAAFNICNCNSLWMRDAERFNNSFKCVPVFSSENGLAAGTDYLNPSLLKRLCKVNSCLSTERSNHTLWLFQVNDIHNIFNSKRLEIQLIRGCIIRRNRLRVVIYNNSLVSHLMNCSYRVNCGIIELHTLSNSDRTRTKNDDLLIVRNYGLVFILISRIEIRHIAIKLAGAGIDHLVNRLNVILLAKLPNIILSAAHQFCYVRIREAHLLSIIESLLVKCILNAFYILAIYIFRNLFNASLVFDYVLDLIQEEHIYLCLIVNNLKVNPKPYQL